MPLVLLATFTYIFGLIYLSLPAPELVPLPNSLRSTEPGDTWQNPDQSAYYTDLDREQALSHYQSTFALNFAGYKLPSYLLNYPPEESSTYVREQLLTYYLEEINHPLRESLFVAGWNPRLSPISDYLFDTQFDRWALFVDGQEYQSKVTIKPVYSPVWSRYLIWTSIFPLGFLVSKEFKQSLDQLAALAK